MDIDKIFATMGDASTGRPKTYMDYGRYVVELKELFIKDSDKDGVPVFVCRFGILESNNPKHEPGTEGSWTLKGKPLQYGQGDIKSLILSAMGFEPAAVKLDSAENQLAVFLFRYLLGSKSAQAEMEALPADQRLGHDFYVGKRVRLETKAKSDTQPFTRHFWTPLKAP